MKHILWLGSYFLVVWGKKNEDPAEHWSRQKVVLVSILLFLFYLFVRIFVCVHACVCLRERESVCMRPSVWLRVRAVLYVCVRASVCVSECARAHGPLSVSVFVLFLSVCPSWLPFCVCVRACVCVTSMDLFYEASKYSRLKIHIFLQFSETRESRVALSDYEYTEKRRQKTKIYYVGIIQAWHIVWLCDPYLVSVKSVSVLHLTRMTWTSEFLIIRVVPVKNNIFTGNKSMWRLRLLFYVYKITARALGNPIRSSFPTFHCSKYNSVYMYAPPHTRARTHYTKFVAYKNK